MMPHRGSITKSSTWRIDTWDDFYYEQYPDESKWLSHRDLGKELDVLINNLEPEKKERKKVATVKRHLDSADFGGETATIILHTHLILCILLEIWKNEKENLPTTSVEKSESSIGNRPQADSYGRAGRGPVGNDTYLLCHVIEYYMRPFTIDPMMVT
ncbi:unnamed protein product [Rhizophagus irregularis]|nr:unnamed protein product [Rhizophagus irregularis]